MHFTNESEKNFELMKEKILKDNAKIDPKRDMFFIHRACVPKHYKLSDLLNIKDGKNKNKN